MTSKKHGHDRNNIWGLYLLSHYFPMILQLTGSFYELQHYIILNSSLSMMKMLAIMSKWKREGGKALCVCAYMWMWWIVDTYVRVWIEGMNKRWKWDWDKQFFNIPHPVHLYLRKFWELVYKLGKKKLPVVIPDPISTQLMPSLWSLWAPRCIISLVTAVASVCSPKFKCWETNSQIKMLMPFRVGPLGDNYDWMRSRGLMMGMTSS